MSKKHTALTSFYVLNILLYGSIMVLFGVLPVVEYGRHPSDMPFGLWFTVFAAAIFAFALICGLPTYFSLNSVLNSADSWLWTLIPLFIAPFSSVAAAFVAIKLFPATVSFPNAIPVGFVLPFVVTVVLARIKNRKANQSQSDNPP